MTNTATATRYITNEYSSASIVDVISEYSSAAIVDAINELHEQGHEVTVNGRKVASDYTPAASRYMNGTVAVTVEGRKPGTVGTVFAKNGQSIHISY